MKRILLLIAIAFSITANATTPVKDFSANTSSMVKLVKLKAGGACDIACGAMYVFCLSTHTTGAGQAACHAAYSGCLFRCGTN